MKITIEHQYTFAVNDLKDIVPDFRAPSKQKLFELSDPPTQPITLTRVSPSIKIYHTFKGHPIKVSLGPARRSDNWHLIETDTDLFKYCFEDVYTPEAISALEAPDCLSIREYKERTPDFPFPMKVRENDKPTPILIQNLSRQFIFQEGTNFKHVKSRPINYITASALNITSYTRHVITNYLRTFGTAFKQARLLGALSVFVDGWGETNNQVMVNLILLICAKATRINLRLSAAKNLIQFCSHHANTILPDGVSVKVSDITDSIISLKDELLLYNAERKD
jgi:hypothetical protein